MKGGAGGGMCFSCTVAQGQGTAGTRQCSPPDQTAALGRISTLGTSLGSGSPFIDSEAMDIAQLGEKGFVIMERKER